MADRLPQLLDQLTGWLEHEHSAGRLRVDANAPLPDSSQAVHALIDNLQRAAHSVQHTAAELDTAHQHAAHLASARGQNSCRSVGPSHLTKPIYDFIGEDGKAIPYGVYDIAANAAWVSVGRDHDTASFAVSTLRRWWQAMGRPLYPNADRLLICADGGGSNGSRVRLWKVELAAFAAESGLQITVCHFPPGTSKWNKIEHRLFSHISMNWRGRPLESHETIVQLIAATTTRTGLKVQAELDDGDYPKGVKITDQQMAALPLSRHDFHGDWNYTLRPE